MKLMKSWIHCKSETEREWDFQDNGKSPNIAPALFSPYFEETAVTAKIVRKNKLYYFMKITFFYPIHSEFYLIVRKPVRWISLFPI